MAVCANSPHGAGETHEIQPGDRRVEVRLKIDWGEDDLRVTHEKTAVFCSFACLSEWAAAKAAEHDAHVLREGA